MGSPSKSQSSTLGKNQSPHHNRHTSAHEPRQTETRSAPGQLLASPVSLLSMAPAEFASSCPPEAELHWECHCISQSFFWPTQWPVLSLHFWPSLHNQDIPGYCLLSGSSLWVPLCFPVVVKFLASALSSFLQKFIHSFMWLQPLSQNLNLNTFPWNHS